VNCNFNTSESWVILSPIEQQIKAKIEAVGTPLKDWDINIYRGILTGYNDAFIITGERKNELIAQDPKSADIIRPILRGRDIKRYGYEFANLWLINSHNGIKEKGINPIDINEYPAIKTHLDQYWDKISIRSDKGDTAYNLRNCAYLEDFYKQKIVFQEMVSEPSFILDFEGKYMCLDTARIITGENLKLLLAVLNSKIFFFSVKYFYGGGSLGELGVRMKHTFFEKFPIPTLCIGDVEKIHDYISTPNIKNIEKIDKILYRSFLLEENEIEFIESQ